MKNQTPKFMYLDPNWWKQTPIAIVRNEIKKSYQKWQDRYKLIKKNVQTKVLHISIQFGILNPKFRPSNESIFNSQLKKKK
jgi:hypothetical protein